jgi:hypothetical protein
VHVELIVGKDFGPDTAGFDKKAEQGLTRVSSVHHGSKHELFHAACGSAVLRIE